MSLCKGLGGIYLRGCLERLACVFCLTFVWKFQSTAAFDFQLYTNAHLHRSYLHLFPPGNLRLGFLKAAVTTQPFAPAPPPPSPIVSMRVRGRGSSRPGFPATSFGPAPASFFQAGAARHHFNPFPHDHQARALRRPSIWPSASSRSASTAPRTPRLRPLTPPNETQTLNLISRVCGPEQARSAATFFSQNPVFLSFQYIVIPTGQCLLSNYDQGSFSMELIAALCQVVCVPRSSFSRGNFLVVRIFWSCCVPRFRQSEVPSYGTLHTQLGMLGWKKELEQKPKQR